jgi:S1-C subfamily serine protease
VGVTAIGAQGAATELPAEGQSVGAQSAVSDLPGERAPVGLAAVGARGALAEAPRVDRAGPPERPGARGLVAAERASLDSAGPGSLALAVARPGTPAPMATFGVITSTGGAWRTAMGGVLDAYLRADVALLPGFSGGAIVDVQGRVLGLLSAHLAGGDSMAIPCAVVDRLVQALLSGGVRHRAYLGISTQAVDLQEAVRQSLGLDQGSGLMLLGLEPGGPAERAGLLLGDIVLAIGGRPVIDGEALQMALGPEVVGKLVAVRLVRGGQLVELSVTPGERP